MGFWSIGKIRGRYQPEDFTETQNLKLKDLITFGGVSRVMFAGWDPREVTISFLVDSVQTTERDPRGERYPYKVSLDGPACPLSEPEEVWRYIQSLQRPYPRPNLMNPIPVYIPGWGQSGDEVRHAYIVNASIKRTHITDKNANYFPYPGMVRASRAVITVTLKEAVFFSSTAAAEKGGQTSLVPPEEG